MKIMSFNTLSCYTWPDYVLNFEPMASMIRDSGADIIGLNEMRGKGEDPTYDDQTRILAELAGYPYYYFAKALYFENHGPFGNGILSKIPILSAQTIPVPQPKEVGEHYYGRSVLKATLEGGLTVLVTHFGLTDAERENAAATAVRTMTKEKCILMGDFNAHPDDPVLDPIRARMKDAAEYVKGPLFSFRSDQPKEKLDYIFVTPDIDIVSAEIPQLVLSDHFPHTAQILVG